MTEQYLTGKIQSMAIQHIDPFQDQTGKQYVLFLHFHQFD